MGFDLHRNHEFDEAQDAYVNRVPDDEGFSANIAGWHWLYNTAVEQGWEPSGTVLEGDPEWEGGYGTNDGQRVTTKDARNWAVALDSGWPYGETSGMWNAIVKRFIRYANGGSFQIW